MEELKEFHRAVAELVPGKGLASLVREVTDLFFESSLYDEDENEGEDGQEVVFSKCNGANISTHA